MQERFRIFARETADRAGSPWAFSCAAIVIVVWMLVGPWSHFSDTWQLVINTATTIVTFLMVFLIQNTQNRDAKVTQLKLDELLRAVEKAHNGLVGLEDQTDEHLARVKAQFESLEKRQSTAKPSRTKPRQKASRLHRVSPASNVESKQ